MVDCCWIYESLIDGFDLEFGIDLMMVDRLVDARDMCIVRLCVCRLDCSLGCR